MNGAIAQGSLDMGIELLFDPAANEGLDEAAIFALMVKTIERYCEEGNAILSTLPAENVGEALVACRDKGTPVLAFNAGHDLAESAGVQFWGQDETKAGYEAGLGLAVVETTEKFCCVNHAPDVDVLKDRCGGFEKAVTEKGKPNFVQAIVNFSEGCDAWNESVLAACAPDEGKDWSTVGIFSGSNSACPVPFIREHPAVYAAFTDTSQEVYDAMSEGLNIIMAIDQQSYLQGYLPFSHLTLAVTNDQAVGNALIETGPHLVLEPPTETEQECVANNFKVCGGEGGGEDSSPSTPDVGDSDAPAPDPAQEGEAPSSRTLRLTTDNTHHQFTLYLGGLVLAVGGFVLAN